MEPEEKAYTIDDLINKAKTYIKSDEEIELIKKAYLFAAKVHAGQLRLTGDAYILHPLKKKSLDQKLKRWLMEYQK